MPVSAPSIAVAITRVYPASAVDYPIHAY
jgi:hypothetical protein